MKYLEDKFDGVHSRLDKINGHVGKNTEHRISSDTTIKNFKWLVGVFGGITILNVLVNIIK